MAGWWILMVASGGWIAFAYLGYPLCLFLMPRIPRRPATLGTRFPHLSLIIAVHNGEHALRRKLENSLALKYPGAWEVVVASDGSTDGTGAIAASFADRGVRLVELPERSGKEAAQREAIALSSGEILVFTDLEARLEGDALEEIVGPFADPAVGAVSSEDVLEAEGGEAAYVRYEMWLRRLESESGTLVGLSGSCFAVRRELAEPWPEDLASDFRIGLETARRGMRAVSEPAARAHLETVSDSTGEWRRKVRTVRRGLAVLFAYRSLLHPSRGRVAFALWGHKVARFTVPFALAVLLAASAAGADGNPGVAVFLVGQLLAYGLGLAALAFPPVGAWAPARIGGFFLLVNASIVVAWFHHVRGERVVIWEPSER